MKLKFIPTLSYLCLLSLLLTLGMWQLNRSEQKQAFLNAQEQRAAAEVLHLSAALKGENMSDLRYRQVEMAGHYDAAHQVLVDNQVNSGKVGYFVLTPFILNEGNEAVLVNRGWIPQGQDRAVRPDLQIIKTEATISGRINNFPSVGIKLAGAEIPTEGWPAIVQVVDSNVLAKKLGYPLFQFQVELAKDLPDGYKRDWLTSTVMPPEQHVAYAMQWFALALTLTILFIWYSLKNNDARSKN